MLAQLRQALRGLLRTPGFTATTLATLALGIGVNTALFSVIRAVLLDPLPYGEPDRAVMVWSHWKDFEQTWVSYDEYELLRDEARSVDEVGLFFDQGLTVGVEDPLRVRAAFVTRELGPVLGVSPALGRWFTADEDRPGGPDVAVLGYGLWQRRFGGDPSVVGRQVVVNGRPFTVVGVMPAGFRLPLDWGGNGPTEVFAPLGIEPSEWEAIAGPEMQSNGGSHTFYAVARLAPGASAASLNAELRSLIAPRVGRTYSEAWNFGMRAVPLPEQVSGRMRGPLGILLGGVLLVLLIACANVAGLLLVRTERRRHEIGVRSALGAARSRIAGQLMAESMALALAGGALGVMLAAFAVDLVRSLAPASLPRIDAATVDAGMLAVSLVLASATALLFGLLPSWHASRVDPAATLREAGGRATASHGRIRARQGLVTAQVALAVVLTVGAGLMVRTVATLLAVERGFQAEHVLTARLSVPSAYYGEADDVSGVLDAVRHEVAALPGVEAAGFARLLPLASEMGTWGTTVEGYAPPPGEGTPAEWQVVTPGYFRALGLQLVAGRFLDERDAAASPLSLVINRRMAEAYFPGRDPLGGRVRIGSSDDAWYTVVGVVENVRQNTLTEEVKPQFYAAQHQYGAAPGVVVRSMSLALRADRNPLTLAGAVRDVVQTVDPRLPLSGIRTMGSIVNGSVARSRFTMALLTVFGALALLLSAIGVFGVVSQVVTARTPEFRIRLALGATPGDVVRRATRAGLVPTALGLVLGGLGAAAMARIVEGMVYGISTTDPVAFTVAGAVIAGVAVLAAGVPARRAASVDAARTLR